MNTATSLNNTSSTLISDQIKDLAALIAEAKDENEYRDALSVAKIRNDDGTFDWEVRFGQPGYYFITLWTGDEVEKMAENEEELALEILGAWDEEWTISEDEWREMQYTMR